MLGMQPKAARIAFGAVLAATLPCTANALSCRDYASLAQSAAIYRDAGVPEQQVVEMVPTAILHSLSDGERVTIFEIDYAQAMARAIYRSRITAKDAGDAAFRRCMGAQV